MSDKSYMFIYLLHAAIPPLQQTLYPSLSCVDLVAVTRQSVKPAHLVHTTLILQLHHVTSVPRPRGRDEVPGVVT